MTFLDSDNRFCLSPFFAGHFQRIIECFLRASTRLDEWLPSDRLQQIVNFCLEHIDILAHQQLMTNFPATLEPV
jgi:hypothetical protein